jgi:hypothetical protein
MRGVEIAVPGRLKALMLALRFGYCAPLSRPCSSSLARDLSAAQTELVRENLQEMIDNTRRIAERSMEVASEAARTITAGTGKAARCQRVAVSLSRRAEEVGCLRAW